MSELLGISSDGQSAPELCLHGRPPVDGIEATGWGLGWYSTSAASAVVVKDPVASGSDTVLNRVLRDWERLRSSVFVCHIRVAPSGVDQEDTHPFLRSYAGRDWIFAHDGNLDLRQLLEFQLGDPPQFEPVGRTDSEYAFCWLLAQFKERGARFLTEVGYPAIHALFAELNHFGRANLLLSDGEDLIAYRDGKGARELYAMRRIPPHDQTHLSSAYVDVDLHDPIDANRSNVLITTSPFEGQPSRLLEPGEMIAIRQGAVVWSSHPTAGASRSIPPTLPGGSVSVQTQIGVQTQRDLNSPPPAPPSAPRSSGPIPPPAVGTSGPPESAINGPVSAVSLMHAGLITTDGHRAATTPLVGKLGPGKAQERVLTVTHETTYRYIVPVSKSAHTYRLRPVEDLTQQVLDHSLEITPAGQSYSFEDVFGNYTTRMKLREPYTELRVVSRCRVRLMDHPERPSPLRRTTIPLLWMPWQRQMMNPYLLPPELPESQLKELSGYAMSFAQRQNHDLIATLKDINLTIYRDFAYVSQSTTNETTPFEVYVNRVGVCQDFANLFICLARLLGVPARYRVGYIFTGADYENKIQSEASHAWAELYLPRVGWRGFDPTNGILVGLDHIRVATGRNYRDATPTSGTIFQGGSGETLHVAVRVEAEGAPSSRSVR